jgi:hypothetical protein
MRTIWLATSLAGEQMFVAQDDCASASDTCDFITAVDVDDPEGWENRLGTIYHGDKGWDIGFHMGRVYGPEVAGWFLLSTYTDGDVDTWAADQLFFVELAPSARVFRVSSTLNAHDGYWSEAFASLDVSAQHVCWCANWMGQANLELYRATLCDHWWDALAGE